MIARITQWRVPPVMHEKSRLVYEPCCMEVSVVVFTLKYLISFLSIVIIGVAEAKPFVVVVQSMDVAPYNEALEGFKNVCRAENRRFILSETGHGEITQKINSLSPDLVLAVGLDALRAVKDLNYPPILYTMVLNPESLVKEMPNITGVSMNVPQEKQLSYVLKVLPGLTRIGMLYDPQKTGQYVLRNRKAAADVGIQILSHEVKSAREVPQTLTNMAVKPDALWLLPDLTVITPETLEYLFSFSLSQKMPVISFSEQYLALGAFMSISLDVFEMGRQTGEIANKILEGKPVRQIPPAEAQKAVVIVNRKVAEKLGISTSDVAQGGIRIVD